MRSWSLVMRSALLRAAFFITLAALCASIPARAQSEAARPEVGKPLQAAQELLKAQKPREALAKIKEADGVGNKTAYEAYIVERVRINAALAAGDADLAAKAFDAAMASGRMTAAERLAIEQALSGTYYRAKDYTKAAHWAQRYFDDGGTDAQMRTLLAQSYYLGGDFAQAVKVVQADIQADERAGRSPAQDSLRLLANAYLKQNDRAGYASALEKLLVHYPKKEYWADVIRYAESRPGFADRLALDVYRLRFAVGAASTADDYMEAAQLALRDGFPTEARNIIDRGFASGALGSGPQADRHARLRDLATKTATADRKALSKDIADAAKEKNGDAKIAVGFAAVENDQFDEGIGLMEQGIRSANLQQPQDARLHLGIAYLRAGRKAQALETFNAVRGNDGAAALARLWAIHVQHTSK